MAEHETTTIRWVWAYDSDGRRITEPEAVGFRHCDQCGGAHPVVDFCVGSWPGQAGPGRGWLDRPRKAARGKYAIVLRPLDLPGVRQVAGIAHGEFPPDD